MQIDEPLRTPVEKVSTFCSVKNDTSSLSDFDYPFLVLIAPTFLMLMGLSMTSQGTNKYEEL